MTILQHVFSASGPNGPDGTPWGLKWKMAKPSTFNSSPGKSMISPKSWTSFKSTMKDWGIIASLKENYWETSYMIILIADKLIEYDLITSKFIIDPMHTLMPLWFGLDEFNWIVYVISLISSNRYQSKWISTFNGLSDLFQHNLF